MNQFDLPADPMAGHSPMDGDAMVSPRTDGLAVGALVCSLILCCPITTLLGPLLGLVSAFRISANPLRKGMGIAITAIVLGLAFTGVQGLVGYGVWTAFQQLPSIAMQAAVDGETAAFRQLCAPPASSATDEEIKAFGAEITRRYGQPVKGSFESMGTQASDPSTPAIRWVVEFENATRDVEVVFPAGATPGGGAIARIRIIDPELGDLDFPAPIVETLSIPEDTTTDETDETEADAGGTGG